MKRAPEKKIIEEDGAIARKWGRNPKEIKQQIRVQVN